MSASTFVLFDGEPTTVEAIYAANVAPDVERPSADDLNRLLNIKPGSFVYLGGGAGAEFRVYRPIRAYAVLSKGEALDVVYGVGHTEEQAVLDVPEENRKLAGLQVKRVYLQARTLEDVDADTPYWIDD